METDDLPGVLLDGSSSTVCSGVRLLAKALEAQDQQKAVLEGSIALIPKERPALLQPYQNLRSGSK